MNESFHEKLNGKLNELKEKGTLKIQRHIDSPMDAEVIMEEKGEIIILSSNNYLGLSADKGVMDAGIKALRKYGAGTASVRFICGTFTIHRELENEIAGFLKTGSALTYVSCWDANMGTIPVIAKEGDAVISDSLNHASLIDGCRMSKAERLIYKHADMNELEACLRKAQNANIRLIITDGVFSMEGDLAPLPEIAKLAEKYDAVTMVDDSHGIGVMGKTGRGTVEHFGLLGKIDIVTGTLGKALGGGAGGFVASSKSVVDTLSQISRPQLFSNGVPPTVAGSALQAIRTLEKRPELVEKLRSNIAYFRSGLKSMGFKPLESESAIIPIIIGETAQAIKVSNALLQEGVFVTGFGYPVVPEGTARIRIQISAALNGKIMDKALTAFKKVGVELGLLS
ncbi:MAG: glycine C-acetyltransferase [Lentisphaerae bacterium]|nr:glycine C-acetyltransferase [Lentisphaerota bacterium]